MACFVLPSEFGFHSAWLKAAESVPSLPVQQTNRYTVAVCDSTAGITVLKFLFN